MGLGIRGDADSDTDKANPGQKDSQHTDTN